MDLKLIKIKSKSGRSDCGNYEWRECVVALPNNKQVPINGDEYLGSPVDDVAVLEEALRHLGYKVEWEYLEEKYE